MGVGRVLTLNQQTCTTKIAKACQFLIEYGHVGGKDYGGGIQRIAGNGVKQISGTAIQAVVQAAICVVTH